MQKILRESGWGEVAMLLGVNLVYGLIESVNAPVSPIKQYFVEQRWVSVEQRLPELNQLVLTNGHFGIITLFWSGYKNCHNSWYAPVCAEPVDWKDVTHWMPLEIEGPDGK